MSLRHPLFAGLILGAMAVATSLFLFPFDCDGAFAVHDGIWMGMGAERANPESSISPHHPLFHVLAIAATGPLRALGVAHPGHVAIRAVAALGAAWLLLQLCALAGRDRVLVGAAFAFVVFSTRGFIVEAAAGENVLPAAAAALFAVTLAARPRPNLLLTGAATTLALLVRQDNIFIVPGIAIAVARAAPGGRRLATVAKLLCGAGAATILCYLATWRFAIPSSAMSFLDWLLLYGRTSWSGPAHLDFARFPTYFHSVTLAMTGQLVPPTGEQPLVALTYVALLLLPGLLLRGTEANHALIAPVLTTLVGRAFFHTWFEAENFEWLVLPIAFVAACSCAMTRGRPATPKAARAAGVALLLGLAAWMLFAHGPYTWRLRERRLIDAIRYAVEVDRGESQFVAWGGRAGTGLLLLGVPHESISDHESLDVAFHKLGAARRVRATTVVGDRLVEDGMPFRMTHRDRLYTGLDGTPDAPGVQLLRREGVVFAVRLARIEDPATPQTR